MPNATVETVIDKPTSHRYIDISGPLSNIPLRCCTPVSLGSQREARLNEFYGVLQYIEWTPYMDVYVHEPTPPFEFTGDAMLRNAIDNININGGLGDAINISIPIGQVLNALSKQNNCMDRYINEYIRYKKTFQINHNLYPPIDDGRSVHQNNAVEHFGKLIKGGWDQEEGADSCVIIFMSNKDIPNKEKNVKRNLADSMSGTGRIHVYKWLPKDSAGNKYSITDDSDSIPGQAMLSLWYYVEDVPVAVAYWLVTRNDHAESKVTSTIIKSNFSGNKIETRCVTSDLGWLSLEQKRLTGATTEGINMSKRTAEPFAYESNRYWSRAIQISGKIMTCRGANDREISVSTGASSSSGTYLLASVPQMQMIVNHFNGCNHRDTPTLTYARLSNDEPRYTFNTHGIAREVHGLGYINPSCITCNVKNSNLQVLTIGLWSRTALFRTNGFAKNINGPGANIPDETIICPNRDLMLFV